MKNKTLVWIIVCLSFFFLTYIGITIYTAWKAKQVSNSILDKFVTVNEQLEKSNQSFEKTNFRLSDSCRKYFESSDPSALSDFDNVVVCHDSLLKHMERLKQVMINKVDANKDSVSLSYYLSANELLMLKAKITGYIDFQNILRVSLKLKTSYTDYLDYIVDDDGTKVSWEDYHFYKLPLAGAVINMSQIESEMSNVLVDLRNELEVHSKKK